MGMFDYFEPSFAIRCPRCGSYENEGQGKGGPCALLVWRQHVAHPIRQAVDEPKDELSLRRFSLPERFDFEIYCTGCHAAIRHCEGLCEQGVWVRTLINDY